MLSEEARIKELFRTLYWNQVRVRNGECSINTVMGKAFTNMGMLVELAVLLELEEWKTLEKDRRGAKPRKSNDSRRSPRSS